MSNDLYSPVERSGKVPVRVVRRDRWIGAAGRPVSGNLSAMDT
ncbi:hypothetical protein ACFPN7_37815 [Amycolatopsis halotolerans]